MNEFERAAWEKRHKSNEHPPQRALEMALEDIKNGELNPEHVLVIYAKTESDGSKGTGYYQAGNLGYHGQLGLLARAMQIMGE